MIRNSGISLSVALILVACSSDSSGETEPADAGGVQRAEPQTAEVTETKEAKGAFEMPVGDVFTITGRGVVVTGQVKSGSISVGDSVCIGGGPPVTVTGIEMYRKELESISAGDMGGLLLDGIAKEDISKDDVVRSCD